jgi:hypothetical protein
MCRTRGVGSSRQGGAGPGQLFLQDPIPIDHNQRSLGTTGKRLWQPGHALAKRMRLAEGHWAPTTGEQDCDLRLLLSKLLPKERADRSLRARQRDHSDAQSVALGTWQHANADNPKGSFACPCYGCTGAGRLFAEKSSRGGFLSRTSLTA